MKCAIFSNSLKPNFVFVLSLSSTFKPRQKVFALTDVEVCEILATICNSFNPNAGYSDAASHG